MTETSKQPIQRWLDRFAERVVKHRLNQNLTQVDLARAAGLSRRTLARLENGEPTQLENFLRTLIALGLEGGLDRLVPDVPHSPIQQLEQSGRARQRASGRRKSSPAASEAWSWGDES